MLPGGGCRPLRDIHPQPSEIDVVKAEGSLLGLPASLTSRPQGDSRFYSQNESLTLVLQIKPKLIPPALAHFLPSGR